MRIKRAPWAALLLFCTTLGAFAAQNYIVVDNQTGQILGGKDPNAKVQVASLTKLATAMVVFDWVQLTKANLNETATVSAHSLAAGGANPTGLMEGDTLSLRDLLYCALIASDNVAATTLAEHVGAKIPNSSGLDPINNFVSHMNALARSLKMNRTLFLNPSGLDSNAKGALPYSSAADLARLTRYAYDEGDLPFYVSQKSTTVHISRGGITTGVVLKNTNELLGQDDIDGVKTGRTNKAGDCLILSSEHKPEAIRKDDQVSVIPKRIIIVLLGSTDRFGEGLTLCRQGWGLYEQWAAKGRKMGPTL
ncbi:N/A [soil metagenome]